mmetsp:Transcript_32261/g.48860  ORF Transcript_32261/g.48860 Transcript_32261/m.48860 type:complete len:91 (-) Transcript_32261:1420-1692(-)
MKQVQQYKKTTGTEKGNNEGGGPCFLVEYVRDAICFQIQSTQKEVQPKDHADSTQDEPPIFLWPHSWFTSALSKGENPPDKEYKVDNGKR